MARVSWDASAVRLSMLPSMLSVKSRAVFASPALPHVNAWATITPVRSTPRERGVIGSFGINGHQGQDRPQESLCLARWQIKNEPQRQSCLDGVTRELHLCTTPACWCWLPGHDAIPRGPQSDVPAINVWAAVLSPIVYTVFRLVLGVHSRFHARIVVQDPQRRQMAHS